MGNWRLKEVENFALNWQVVKLEFKPRVYNLNPFLEALTLLPQQVFVCSKQILAPFIFWVLRCGRGWSMNSINSLPPFASGDSACPQSISSGFLQHSFTYSTHTKVPMGRGSTCSYISKIFLPRFSALIILHYVFYLFLLYQFLQIPSNPLWNR